MVLIYLLFGLSVECSELSQIKSRCSYIVSISDFGSLNTYVCSFNKNSSTRKNTSRGLGACNHPMINTWHDNNGHLSAQTKEMTLESLHTRQVTRIPKK